jgi:hypothetical protein
VAEWEIICDGRAVGRTSIKALVGAGHLHGRQLLYPHGVGNRSSTRVGGGAHVVRLGPRANRGGDLSCEAETCRAGPSSGELVGDAAN